MSISEDIKNVVLSGIKDVRNGSLAMIIANGISLISTLLLMIFIFPLLMALPRDMVIRGSIDLLRLLGASRVLIVIAAVMGLFCIVSLILAIYAIYIKLIPGSNKLKKWREDFSTPSMLMKIGYIGGLIVIIAGVIIIVMAIISLPTIGGGEAFSSPMNLLRFLMPLFGGLAIILIGGLLGLVGNIGLILLFFRLHSIFNEVLLLASAVIFIIAIIMGMIAVIPLIGIFISIALSILLLIAWILSYTGLGNIVRRIDSQSQALQQTAI